MTEDVQIDSERLRNFITFRLSRVQSKLNAQAIRILKEHSGISLTEWRVILLAASGSISTLSDLARETHLDKGQLSRAISSLTRKKLLQSKINKSDHRQHNLSVTRAGQAEYEKLLPIMRQRQSKLVSRIAEKDLSNFARVLNMLEDSVDQE